MTALASPAAFDVKNEAKDVLPTIHTLNNLEHAPRLPVDLALLLIEIRKNLEWTTRSFNTALLGGISDTSLNPVRGNLIAEEGEIFAEVSGDGTKASVRITPSTREKIMVDNNMHERFNTSQPFMPSMTDPLWTPPGLNDPFMKVDATAEVTRERGWPANFNMPWTYGRFGQGVNGDLHDCKNLPEDVEDLFLRFINAARETRVSIMGVMASNLPNGGYASLAISESDMELRFFRKQRLAYATFFTCGNSNPRPALDKIHQSFDAGVTRVDGYVRGRDVPYMYEGTIVRGGNNQTIWKDKPFRQDDQLMFGDRA
jgi:S-adenosylmethionine/arginine decarboxylase-like enzyme